MTEREPLKLTDRSMGIWRKVEAASLGEFAFMDELDEFLADHRYIGRSVGRLALSLVERGQYESALAHNPRLSDLDPVRAAESVLYPEPLGVTDPMDVEIMGVDYYGSGPLRSVGLSIADTDGLLQVARDAYEERLNGNTLSQWPFRPHISIGQLPKAHASRRVLGLARLHIPKRIRLAPVTSHPTLEELRQLFPLSPHDVAS